MERKTILPRKDYAEKVKNLGLSFHKDYWLENAYYVLSNDEVATLEIATKKCYEIYCAAVEACLYDEQKLNLLKIPLEIRDAVRRSWEEDDLSLYGRFDFALINGVPKLLEFNADTPTTLLESAVIQWQWKEERFPNADQFNSIHEALIQSWVDIHKIYKCEQYFFSSITDCEEDNITMDYILETAKQAGLNVAEMDIRDIELNNGSLYCGGEPINCMFKLYPWEFMFEKSLDGCQTEMCWIEPLWKSLMSNKAMLPILYEIFPNNEYILPAFFDKNSLSSYCKKPIFSREGSNIELICYGNCLEKTDGEYGQEGYIYQEFVNLPNYQGKYPILGSWVIGGEACGLGIRESDTRITRNMANFVPHIIL